MHTAMQEVNSTLDAVTEGGVGVGGGGHEGGAVRVGGGEELKATARVGGGGVSGSRGGGGGGHALEWGQKREG
jgi:hypothetical protein